MSDSSIGSCSLPIWIRPSEPRIQLAFVSRISAAAPLNDTLPRSRVCRIRLVLSGHRTKPDSEPVPAVDRDDRERQVNQFLFRKMLPHLVVNVARSVPLVDECDSLGPGKRGPFAIREERGFSP